MQERIELVPWLVVWVIVSAYIVRNQWKRDMPSTGLPIAYILSLTMIHFFGALIYSFPWYTSKTAYRYIGVTYYTVSEGFLQSAYGVIAFGVGSTIVAEWLVKSGKLTWLQDKVQQPVWQFSRTYLVTGLFFIAVIGPVLGGLSVFTGLITSGICLFVVGLCLYCWQAWCNKDTRSFWLYLGITCCLPVFTIITMGFIGFGASAASVVLVFIFSFYRPRWRVLLAAFLAFYIGLSVFVTYMRDRSEIRAKVWGDNTLNSKIERLSQTLQKFEFIDFYNQKHLELIDIRINQNDLVGKSVDYLENRKIRQFGNGVTLWNALIAPIPRALWPGKPEFGGSGSIVTDFTGLVVAKGTSFGVGQVLEFYLNFGTIGVMIGFFVLGLIIRIIDITAAFNLRCGNIPGFVSWYLPGLGMLDSGGSLAEMAGSVSASIALMIIINQIYARKRYRV